MRTQNSRIRMILASLCVGLLAASAFAADPFKVIPEEELTLQAIKGLFDAAFIKAEFDSDGDLKIMDGGFKTFIKVDPKKKLVSYIAAWGLKKSVPEIKKLQLVNKLNDELIYVRFCMPNSTTLWCDYQLLYEGGVTPYAIVNNYKLFARVVKGAVATKDPEDIIGSD